MCKRCAELLTENARLRDLLELRTRADLIGRVRAYLGVTDGQARLLLRLFRDRGGVVSIIDLHNAVPIRYRNYSPRDRGDQFIRTMFAQTRKHLPADCIETARGYGYRLTPKGVAILAEALSGEVAFLGVAA